MMQAEAQRDIALPQLPLRGVVHECHDVSHLLACLICLPCPYTARGRPAKNPLRALAPIMM